MSLGPKIAALSGEARRTNQTLLADFVQRRRADGLRVVGVVEFAERSETGVCGRLSVIDLATGASIAISQNLGPGSTACNLDPGGVAEACAAAQRAIAAGADLVVLSKFGKLEAARGGLCDAFAAAIEAELPVVTTVNPVMREEWARFAGTLSEDVCASAEALEAWWSLAAGASRTDRRGAEAA
jgi:nucleoside-triphosphatase THEP1